MNHETIKNEKPIGTTHSTLQSANGDWVIYNKKTGKRLTPSKSWRKWLGAKAAASKIGGDAEVADVAWYQDNKDKLIGEASYTSF